MLGNLEPVITGRPVGPGPESKNTGLGEWDGARPGLPPSVFMVFGLVGSRPRPGMTLAKITARALPR